MATKIVQTAFDVNAIDVTFAKKRYNVPRFFSCVRGNNSMSDSRDVLETLSQPEALVFWRMDKYKNTDTNEVEFTSDHCGLSKTSTYPKTVNSLIAKNMIIRTKQNNYIINPNITLPKFEFYETVLAKWKLLGGK